MWQLICLQLETCLSQLCLSGEDVCWACPRLLTCCAGMAQGQEQHTPHGWQTIVWSLMGYVADLWEGNTDGLRQDVYGIVQVAAFGTVIGQPGILWCWPHPIVWLSAASRKCTLQGGTGICHTHGEARKRRALSQIWRPIAGQTYLASAGRRSSSLLS